MPRRLLSILALLAAALPLYAQKFSGSAEGVGSWNFAKNNQENANLKLNYDSPKWYIHTSFSANHKAQETSSEKFSANSDGSLTEIVEIDEDNMLKDLNKLTFEDKGNKSRNWGGSGSVDAGIRFSQANLLKISASYDLARSESQSSSLGMKLSRKDTLMGMQGDEKAFKKNTATLSLEFTHNFGEYGRVIGASVSGLARFDLEEMTRGIFNLKGNYYKGSRTYEAPSYLIDLNFNYKVWYTDNLFLGFEGLSAKVGIDATQNNDIDIFSSAEYVDDEWIDLPMFHQEYEYSSLNLEPYLTLKYSFWKFDFNATEKGQFYGHQLFKEDPWNQNDPGQLDFRSNDIRNLADVSIVYHVTDKDKLTLGYSHTMSRPDYSKVSSIVKVGDYEGEYYVGNYKLKPQINDKVTLRYDYTFKRIFSAYALLTFNNQRNRTERVVDNKTEGVTYYTYINSQRQQTSSLRGGIRGQWDKLKAEVYAQFNYESIDYENKNKATKYTKNWDFYATVSYTFPKNWVLSAQGGYSSMKESAFNASEAYVATNVRLSKTFFRKLDVYLEGRDLTDREICTYTWNEALDFCSINSTENLRRALALGIKYSF